MSLTLPVRRAFALLLALSFAAACGPSQDAPADQPEAGEPATGLAITGDTYGEPITLDVLTPISTIMEDPEAWVGERVLVEGMITEVCEMRGCWMDIASDREYETIRIKVDDGVIVFPLSARGKTALVEGVVEVIELTYEEALEQARNQAEEHGEEFDPSMVTGPSTTYQVRGLGAVIAS